MNQKTHKYTLGKLEERKLQTIGDSSNNDREGTQKSSIKKDFYKNFIKITGKYMRQILFFNKVLGLLHHRYFPVKFEKILRTLFSVNISGGYFFQMSPNIKMNTYNIKINQK